MYVLLIVYLIVGLVFSFTWAAGQVEPWDVVWDSDEKAGLWVLVVVTTLLSAPLWPVLVLYILVVWLMARD